MSFSWNAEEVPLASYIVRNRDSLILEASSSGGAFSAFATVVIKDGGVVFGAEYQGHRVAHAFIDNEADLVRFRGSKYAQSDIGTSYQDVHRFLSQGRSVLFSGTPCQVAALNSYLAVAKAKGDELDRLYTIDFVCHGVGSPKAFEYYLRDKEREGAHVSKVNMRSKKYGYRAAAMELIDEHGRSRYISGAVDDYLRAFYGNYILRPSCYACVFKTAHRASDLTMWDSWMAEEILGIVPDNRGYTNVVVQSKKGERLMACSSPLLEAHPVNFERIRPSKGGSMLHSASFNPRREEFFKGMCSDGFERTMVVFEPLGLRSHIKEIVKSLLGYLGLRDYFSRVKRRRGQC